MVYTSQQSRGGEGGGRLGQDHLPMPNVVRHVGAFQRTLVSLHSDLLLSQHLGPTKESKPWAQKKKSENTESVKCLECTTPPTSIHLAQSTYCTHPRQAWYCNKHGAYVATRTKGHFHTKHNQPPLGSYYADQQLISAALPLVLHAQPTHDVNFLVLHKEGLSQIQT